MTLLQLKWGEKAIKGDFEMHGKDVKYLKATGTHWIDHGIRAMGRLVDKFGLYARHMKELIDKEKNSKTEVRVKRKLKKFWMLRFFRKV